MNKVEFKDKVFEKAIREMFDFKADIYLEDLEKIEEIVFYDSDRDNGKEMYYITLDGQIESLEDLKYFPNLSNLSLNFSDPENPEIFGNLKDVVQLHNLKILNLSGSIIEGNLSLLKPLKKLERLVLTGGKISGKLKSLAGLKKLKRINLCDTTFHGKLKDLSGLDLESLVLGWTKVEGDLSHLKAFPNLRVVDFISCENISGDIKVLKFLNNLEDVTLSESNVYGDVSSFSYNKNLKFLDLSFTEIDGNPLSLVHLEHLIEADLSFTDIDISEEIQDEIGRLGKASVIKLVDLDVLKDIDDSMMEPELEEGGEFREVEFRYNDIDLNILENYRTKYIGRFDSVFHEIVSDEFHIDVYISEPTEERDYYILMTEGMGAYRMDVPEELGKKDFSRCELMIYLPSDWNFDFSDEENYWPIRCLKTLARFPFRSNAWFSLYHTISNGDNSFSENNDYKNTILFPYIDMESGETSGMRTELSSGDMINFYSVVPIYDEELLYKLKYDGYQLLKEMRSELSIRDFMIVDTKRKNTFTVDKFHDFEKYSDSRIEIDNPDEVITFEDEGFEEAIRALYSLEGDIKRKDLGYREELDFVSCFITGGGFVDINHVEVNTKIKSFRDLKYFENLLSLGLDYGNPGNPSIFGELKDVTCLKRLVELNLGGAIVKGDISELKKLPNLREIVLTGQGIEGNLSDLRDFTDLECLYICDTRVEGDIKDISHMTNLDELTLSYSLFSGDVKYLKDMHLLETVDITDSDIVGDIVVFESFPHMKQLTADSTGLYGDIEAFSNSNNLEELSLENCNVEGDIESLKNCKKLKALNISYTDVTGESEVLLEFQNLINLSISDCDLEIDVDVMRELSYDEVNIHLLDEEEEENYEEDDENSVTVLHRESEDGMEYFVSGMTDVNEAVIHTGFVGDKGNVEYIECSREEQIELLEEKMNEGFSNYDEEGYMEELEFSIADYPRVNPHSLSESIDGLLGILGLGYLAYGEIIDDKLMLRCLTVDEDKTREIIISEFGEYEISFE